MQRVNAHVRSFAPEHWGEVDFFKIFYGGSHKLKPDNVKALGGISGHFHKAHILSELAVDLLPALEIDEQELYTNGHTAAKHGSKFAAVVEGIFTELYSAVECARKIISDIYVKAQGLPSDSTRRFFRKIQSGEVGSGLPDELKEIIGSCDWYEELRVIRDELTHADVGHCSLERDTGHVQYSHFGARLNGQCYVIPDVMGRIEKLFQQVNQFLGAIFNFLNSQLQPTEVNQLCGFFFGRGYLRKLPMERPINFHTGTCMSLEWFEKEEGFRCPFADDCGAYHKAKAINA